MATTKARTIGGGERVPLGGGMAGLSRAGGGGPAFGVFSLYGRVEVTGVWGGWGNS